MKNRLNIWLMASAVLCACTGSDDEGTPPAAQQVAVSFSTSVNATDGSGTTAATGTRATTGLIEDLDGLKALAEGFGVFGYLTDDRDWTTARSTARPEFMQNQPVLWNTGKELWEYDPPKYWPNSTGNVQARRISFFAYAPFTDADAAAVEGATGIVGLPDNLDPSPHIVYRLGTPGQQEDLLYASCTDATRNGRGLIEVSGDAHTYQRVPLTFHHALACVEVYIQRLEWQEQGGVWSLNTSDRTKLFISNLSFTASPAEAFSTQGRLDLETGLWSDLVPVSTTPALSYTEDMFQENLSGTLKTLADANGLTYIRNRELAKWSKTDYGIDHRERPLFDPERSLLFFPYESDITLTPMATYSTVLQDNSLQKDYIEDAAGNRYLRQLHKDVEGNQLKLSLQRGKKYRLLVHIGVEGISVQVASVEDWDFPLLFRPNVESYKEQEENIIVNEE